MYFGRILRLYVACLGVLFCQAIVAALPSSGPVHGLLWEIDSPDSSPSYLFGTIHSEDPGVIGLAPTVESAFTSCRQVILEVNLDTDAMVAGSTAMLLTDGRRLSEIVGKGLFEQTAVALRTRGISDPVAERMKPWAAASALSMPAPVTGLVLDMVLFQRAQQAGKQLHGLETIAEQLEVFEGLPLDDQVTLLRDAVEQFAGLDAMQAELLAAYKRQDLAAMMAINAVSMATGDQRLAREFERRLIEDRNHRMAERMEPYLKQGGAFVAVGALHLPGEQGLLRLLEQRGYSLRVVE
ncbi:MAG: TraB/GumN family protein [Gammaproteobacteria bacterium]